MEVEYGKKNWGQMLPTGELIIFELVATVEHTTETKDFVLYNEVSFAQGVIVDHAPLIIVASYAGARLWT